jgi:hypothetical protein
MKKPADIAVEILKEIRDEAKKTNAQIHETNARIGETNVRLDALRDELGRRIVESEWRTSTALTDLAGTVREMTSVLRSQAHL